MKRRGVQIDGDAVRDARKLRGWSQAELAEKAGIAERTVRNAENGRAVELHIADYLAGALDLSVGELLLADSDSPQRKRWKQIIADLQHALTEAVVHQQFEPMKELVHPNVVMCCFWHSFVDFSGEYHGYSGAVTYATRVGKWLQKQNLAGREAVIEVMDGDGDLLFLRGTDTYKYRDGSASNYWFAHFYRLEDGKVRTFEQFCGNLPMSQLEHEGP